MSANGALVRPLAIGVVAHAALTRSGGAARVLTRSTASTYLRAGDEVVWLGATPPLLHPRGIVVAGARTSDSREIRVALDWPPPWRPPTLRLDATAVPRLVAGWRRLAGGLARVGPPVGLGERLTGGRPRWPLDAAAPAADELARACGRDDPAAATAAALDLLGVGTGLTPSGDDFVGGVLFARRLLAETGVIDRAAWRRARDTIVAAAPSRTHPVSAAVLGDLAVGIGWAPLHDLVPALADESAGAAEQAARRLVHIGHSSGWDLLAGFGAGLGSDPMRDGTAPARLRRSEGGPR